MRLPVVVLACKSDLERQVNAQSALQIIQQYDAGLVEVSSMTEQGREKMKRSFQWLLRSIMTRMCFVHRHRMVLTRPYSSAER